MRLRAVALAMTLQVALFAAAPICAAGGGRADAAEAPVCCRAGHGATCPMHKTVTPASMAAAAHHGAPTLCRCSRPDVGLAVIGLVGPVVDRFAGVPDRVLAPAKIMADDSRLDTFPVPPAPPPKSQIAIL